VRETLRNKVDEEFEVEVPTMVFELHEELIPEQRFMLAMLVRAIRDLAGNDIEERNSAWRWISGEESEAELPFEEICSGLNYDVNEMRSQLLGYFAQGEVQ
jgi:hypothetical protein